MPALILFGLVLFVTGGVIAYIGDRLGTYIGKKRHTLWGLRPRYTAMVWTVASGGVIALLTLFALLGVDQSVQRALLQGREIIRENGALARANGVLAARNRRAEETAQSADAAAASAQQAALAARGEARTARQDVETTRLDLRLTQVKLRLSRAELGRRQARLAAAQAHLRLAAAHVKLARAELGRDQVSLRESRRRIAQARSRMRQAQAQYRAATRAALAVGREVIALTRQQTALEAKNADLNQQNLQLATQVQSSQGGSLAFRRGEELGRRVVDATRPLDAIEGDLQDFLGTLSRAAQAQGASGVRLAWHDDTPAASGRPSADTGDAPITALAQTLSAQSRFSPSVVLIATSRYNTFDGQQAVLDLKALHNALVFPKGTRIATTTIDGSQPAITIQELLEEFLLKQVRPVALRDGIIPTYDPQSGEPLIGEPIESFTYSALISRIQQIGAGATVTASAAQDTYSSGPLRLDLVAASPLDLSPVPPAPAGAGLLDHTVAAPRLPAGPELSPP